MSTPQIPEPTAATTPLSHDQVPASHDQAETTQLPFSAPQPQATAAYAGAPQQGSDYGQAPVYQTVPAGYQAARPVPQGTTLQQTNTYAFLAIMLAFIAPVAGIVFGHMGLSQIKRTGDSGRGIALTGLIISYAWFAFMLTFIVLYIGFIAMMVGLASNPAMYY